LLVPENQRRVKCPKCDHAFGVGDLVEKPRKESRPTRRRDTDEEDDRPTRPRRKRQPEQASSGGWFVAILVACLFVVLGAGVAALVIFMPGKDNTPDKNPGPIANGPGNPAPNPPVPPGINNPPAPGPGPIIAGGDGLPPAALQTVRAATVQVRAFTPGGGQSSGSGFFAIAPGLVVTNAHVIDMLEPGAPPPPRIDLVLNSGDPGERTVTATVATVDRDSDLALLRAEFPPGTPLPAPLPVGEAKNLNLTQKVVIFGFPFGTRLGKEITISSSSVSSLRTDKQGLPERIQVNGGMNPGNSGGPVVDTNGVVVGVAVSGIRNTQIQFAIPGEHVTAVARGRITEAVVGDTYRKGSSVAVRVTLTASDPQRGLKEVGVEWWLGQSGAERPATDSAPNPVVGDGPVQLVAGSYDAAAGKGEVELILPEVPAGKVLWVQPRFLDAVNQQHWFVAQACPVLPPIETRPVTLTHRHEAILAKVDLKIQADLRLRGSDSDQHSRNTRISATFQENVTGIELNGDTKLSLTGEQPTWVETIDGETSQPLTGAILGSQPLGLILTLDPQGSVITRKAVVAPSAGSAAKPLETLGEQMLNALEILAIPVPAGQVRPGQSWRATRPLPLGKSGRAEKPALDVVYTLRGSRTEGGREFAVVDVSGTLRGTANPGGKAQGQARGEATIDAASGRVVQARVIVDLTLDLFFRDADVHATGRVETSLLRQMQGVTAPTRPDNGPTNSLQGEWIFVGTEADGKPVPSQPGETRITINDKTFLFKNQQGPPVRWYYTLVGPAGKDGGNVNISPFTPGDGYPAIYRIEGDILKVCVNHKTARRPTDCVTFPDSGFRVTTFKRAPATMNPTTPPILMQPDPIAPDPFTNDPNLKVEPDRPRQAPPAPVREKPAPFGELTRLNGHEDTVYRLAYSPDGSRLASASNDGTVRLWDTETGKELGCLNAKAGVVHRVAFSPDGKFLLTSHRDTSVRLWNATTFEEVRRLEGTYREAYALAFSANARYAIAGGDSKGIRLWEVSTGKLLRRMDGHTGQIFSLTFSPDGTQILSGAADSSARVWDVVTGQEVRKMRHELVANVATYSPDGRQILTAGPGPLILWDAATGQEIRRCGAIDNDSLWAAAFTPDGRYAVAGGSGRVVYIVDLVSGMNVFRSEYQPRFERAVAISPGCGRIVLGDEKSVRVLALPDEAARAQLSAPPRVGAQPQEVRKFPGMEQQAGCLAVSPDGRRLAAVEAKGIRVWDATTGKAQHLLACKGSWVKRLVFAPDSRTLISAGGGYGVADRPEELDIRVWNVETGIQDRLLVGHKLTVLDIAVSADGNRLLSGSNDQTMRLWDLRTGKELASVTHPGRVSNVAFTTDGRQGLSGGQGMVLLWDLETKREIRSLDKHPALALVVLPDGKHVLTGCADGTLRTWELATGREVSSSQTAQVPLQGLHLSADGRRVLLTGGKSVRLWDIAAGKEVCQFEHPDGYGTTTIAPDGNQMFSSMADKTLRLLQLSK
jgi:uncharacterized protein (TIGR03067 family)